MSLYHEFVMTGTVVTPAAGEAAKNVLVVKFDEARGGKHAAYVCLDRFPVLAEGDRIVGGVQFCDQLGLRVLTISAHQPKGRDWVNEVIPPVLGHQ